MSGGSRALTWWGSLLPTPWVPARTQPCGKWRAAVLWWRAVCSWCSFCTLQWVAALSCRWGLACRSANCGCWFGWVTWLFLLLALSQAQGEHHLLHSYCKTYFVVVVVCCLANKKIKSSSAVTLHGSSSHLPVSNNFSGVESFLVLSSIICEGKKKMDFRALEIKEETLRLWESGFFLWKFLSCVFHPHTPPCPLTWWRLTADSFLIVARVVLTSGSVVAHEGWWCLRIGQLKIFFLMGRRKRWEQKL